ncbi:MAG: hypothetical protein OIF50_08350, partial [Flavobacteriaceae bacterium]|nr:hypothetical protein [Flavobacteriaceae bacterium]
SSVVLPIQPEDLKKQCQENAQEQARIQANTIIEEQLHQRMIQKLIEFKTIALGSANETFTATYTQTEHHYTLYYYDQAGNLVQTVPPEGVNTNGSGIHHKTTRYRYNSLGQPIWQETPDGGQTQFFYNKKQQLRFSQNAQQKQHGQLSYTKYDPQERITEVGQMLTFQWDGTPNKSPDFNKLKQNIDYPQFPKYDTLPQNQADRADYIQLTQITKTIYDQTINQNSNQNNTFITVDKVDENQKPIAFTSITQENLRGRVAHSFTFNQANQLGRFTTANQTLYSYDQHGNVHKIVQLLNALQKPKFIDYEYDLISGNVHKVWYQKKQHPTDSIPHDQFIHRYFYDADNRITRVQTSRDNHIWNTDAKYHYYAHGPLARVELG